MWRLSRAVCGPQGTQHRRLKLLLAEEGHRTAAAPAGALRHRCEGVRRDQHDDRVGMGGAQAACRLESIHPGHADVDQKEIRTHGVREREPLLSGCSLAQLLEAVRRLDNLPSDLAEYRVVVHDQDSHEGSARARHLLSPFGRTIGRVHCIETFLSYKRGRNEAGLCPPSGLHASPRGCAHHDPGKYLGVVAIRVALADDSLLVREGLEQLLAAETGIEVVASCEDLPSLFEAIEAERPAVVLTDIRMPPSQSDEGLQFAARLRETDPAVGVVVLSQYAEPSYALALLESGSDGRAYLLKDRVHDRAQLVSAVEEVARGGSVVDPKIVEVLVAAKARGDRSPLDELTPREREVLAEIAQGKSNSAIADSLVLTKRAVEKHINSIFLKLNLSEAEDVSKRVTAALTFLAEEPTGSTDGSAR
jgi:DNA-binding NarL/FixJ family response regulator